MKVAENPYEHCVSEFYRLCDTDKDQQVSLNEWGDCFTVHLSKLIVLRSCSFQRMSVTLVLSKQDNLEWAWSLQVVLVQLE